MQGTQIYLSDNNAEPPALQQQCSDSAEDWNQPRSNLQLRRTDGLVIGQQHRFTPFRSTTDLLHRRTTGHFGFSTGLDENQCCHHSYSN